MTSITLDPVPASLVARGILRVVPLAGVTVTTLDWIKSGERVDQPVTIVANNKWPMNEGELVALGDWRVVSNPLRVRRGEEIYRIPLDQPVGSAVVEAVVPILPRTDPQCHEVPCISFNERTGALRTRTPDEAPLDDISDHLPFFDWTPSGECGLCQGRRANYAPLSRAVSQCFTCGGSGRIDRFALILRNAEEAS